MLGRVPIGLAMISPSPYIMPPSPIGPSASGIGTGCAGLTAALNLAQSLLCERPGANGLGCGECPGCHYCRAGQHPDQRHLDVAEERRERPFVFAGQLSHNLP